MSAESSLVSHLVGHPGLAAIVGDRVYPSRIPDGGTTPCVVYQRISTSPVLASGSVPLRRSRFQLDAYADRYSSVVDVAAQLRAALDMAAPAGLVASVPDTEDDQYDTDAALHRRRIDYYIWEQ